MKLTIIIPAFNEEKTIKEVINKVLSVRTSITRKEIIVVSDGSTDQTAKIARSVKNKQIRVLEKPKNQGKGAAIRDALTIARGDVILIQDADLEYDPADYQSLLAPILDNKADVVFGSRFLTTKARRVLYFWHFVGNWLLTLMTNLVTNLNLSDMETCYKVFTKDVAKNLDLKESRFGFEPEFTIKASRLGFRIYEVGISYSGRGYSEGKKINWKDGLWAILCIFKYGFD